MQISREIAKGQLVQLTFMQDAVAASQTNVQLPIAEVNAGAAVAVDSYVMPFAGEVVAISAVTTAAATAGSLTVGATKDGTEWADPTLTLTTGTEAWDTCPRGTCQFAAGDQIGAEITSSGTWDGTTADLGVSVWVLLYLEGI
jgi:hypothetical protein